MKNLTAETRRRGEESGDLLIARDRVIGKDAYICHPERVGANATASRGPRQRVKRKYSVRGFSRNLESSSPTLQQCIEHNLCHSARDL